MSVHVRMAAGHAIQIVDDVIVQSCPGLPLIAL